MYIVSPMKIQTSILPAILLCISSLCHAQISLGPAAGFHLTEYSLISGGKKQAVSGAQRAVDYRLGGCVDVPLGKRLHLQPGIYYTSNGSYRYFAGTSYRYSFNIHAVEFPMLLTYRFGMKHQSHYFAGAGAVMGIHVGGYADSLTPPSIHMPQEVIRTGITFGPANPAFAYKYNISLLLCAGYHLKKGLWVRVNYQQGFTDLQPGGYPGNYSVRSNNFGLTAGWLFLTKNKEERTEAKNKPKPAY